MHKLKNSKTNHGFEEDFDNPETHSNQPTWRFTAVVVELPYRAEKKAGNGAKRLRDGRVASEVGSNEVINNHYLLTDSTVNHQTIANPLPNFVNEFDSLDRFSRTQLRLLHKWIAVNGTKHWRTILKKETLFPDI